MNLLSNVRKLCKNLFFKPSPVINVVTSVSHFHRMSMVRKGRKPVNSLWPNQPKYWPGGEKYFGFTYYPRYPDQQDPEWERTPLFMVSRRKQYRNNPFWLKRILRNLRIEQNINQVAIVLNSENMNRTLWKVKHLITITPITFPDGIPEEKDIDACRLYPNGELRFKTTLKIDPIKMNATELFQQNHDRIDKYTINKYTRKKWDDGYSLLKDY